MFSSELSRSGFSSRSISSSPLARQLKRETEVVAAEAELSFVEDAAHALLTTASIRNMKAVLDEAKDAIADDPFGAEYYRPLVRAYSNGAGDRLGAFRR